MHILNKIINIFGNSILFYKDNSEHSVFKNYCLFKNTGCRYNINLTKPEAGKILEYRLELDKKLNIIYILIPIFVYFVFIHSKYNLFSILWCEFLWIFLASFFRITASNNYSKFLVKNSGEYELTEFLPNLTLERQRQIQSNFYSKICIIFVSIMLFFIPAFLLIGGINLSMHTQKPHTKIANALSKIYLTFYPKTQRIYDIQALVRFKNNDLKGAYNDYKTVLEFSGKNFTQKDYTRFANMLFIEKQLASPAQALDSFNDYMTRKKMTPLEQVQMLWIKSIFSIENHISDSVIQDYDDMLLSLEDKDEKNKFYVNSDKAYMLYLMGDYREAVQIYNSLIQFAQNKKDYSDALKSLYAERGFARHRIGDTYGANRDFIDSKIPLDEINSYEPSFLPQEFIVEKF